MPEFDFTGWPVWIVALLITLNLFKEPLARLFPAAFSAFISKSKWEAEQQAIHDEAERQDDIAILSAMVQLQTEAIKQNERLLDFIINRLDSRLSELGQSIKTELTLIRQELADINQRWLAAATESNREASFHHLTRIELSKLVDRFEVLERKIAIFTRMDDDTH